jgi:hypothetical protein
MRSPRHRIWPLPRRLRPSSQRPGARTRRLCQAAEALSSRASL